MREQLFYVRKGTKRILLIFKILFLTKWMKTDGVPLTKQIFLKTYYMAGSDLMLAGRMNTADKKINNDLDSIYLISDDLKCNRGNRKRREGG